MSPLKRSSLNVVSSLWEELAQFLQDILGDTHENDIGHWLEVTVLLVLWSVSQGLEQNVRFQVVQNLVVSEVGVLRKIEDWLLLVELIVLVVVNLDETLSDEVHLLNIRFITNNSLSGCVNSAIHADDQFVGETSLAFFKEVVE